jgi:hypothetical protein
MKLRLQDIGGVRVDSFCPRLGCACEGLSAFCVVCSLEQFCFGRGVPSKFSHPSRKLLVKQVPGTNEDGDPIQWPATKFALQCQSLYAEFFGVRHHHSRELRAMGPHEMRPGQAKRKLGRSIEGSSMSIKAQKRQHDQAVHAAVAAVKAGKTLGPLGDLTVLSHALVAAGAGVPPATVPSALVAEPHGTAPHAPGTSTDSGPTDVPPSSSTSRCGVVGMTHASAASSSGASSSSGAAAVGTCASSCVKEPTAHLSSRFAAAQA